MSRASIKELQSLALFGWDRQHGHAPNGELLNMPSHAEHTRFYQSGRQRRKRSSGIVQPTAGDSTTTHPSKSKPRRSSTSVSTAKFAPTSQRRQFEGQRVSCEPGVRPGHQAPKQGSSTELSPVKTSIQIKCTSHATPSVMENSDKVNFQGDRASSQSTAEIPSTQRFSTCTPNFQGTEVSGCPLPKQNASSDSAGCTNAQSNACIWDDPDQSASMPPSKSPLHSEYTPYMQSFIGHSSVSAVPAGSAPASPTSAICAPSSPTSPLSLTHDQENRPPPGSLSPRPQLCHNAVMSASRHSCQHTVLEETSAGAAGDHQPVFHPPQNTGISIVHDNLQPTQDHDMQNAPFSGIYMPRAVQRVGAEESAPDFSRPGEPPTAKGGEAEATEPLNCDADTAVHIDGPATDHPRVVDLGPQGPDRPTGQAPVTVEAIQRLPAAVAGPLHTVAATRTTPNTSVEAGAGHKVVLGDVLDRAAERRGASNASPRQQQPQRVLTTATAASQGHQLALVHAARSEGVPICISGAPFSCAELQRQLDRNAMPPPKPKRARTQASIDADGREQSKPCDAAGFWQDACGAADVELPQLPLFMDSYHLPLFQPSPSLPSGNSWILTFLP